MRTLRKLLEDVLDQASPDETPVRAQTAGPIVAGPRAWALCPECTMSADDNRPTGWLASDLARHRRDYHGVEG